MAINYTERKIDGLRSIQFEPCLWGQLQGCCSVISSELNEHVKWKMLLLLIMVFSLRACLWSTSQTLIKEPLEKALPTHGSMCCVCLLWIRKSLQKKCLHAGEISIELRLLIRTLFLGLCLDVLLYRDDPVKMQLWIPRHWAILLKRSK